ncbi:hypothetical protein [Citreimonas sp.]|uniref:hypothetical protein n=1 Tax=Citreimonas sp. TaxID=3036715 RepID=UPI0040597FAD
MTKVTLKLHVAPHDIELMPGVTVTVEPFRRGLLRDVDEECGLKAARDAEEEISESLLEKRVVTLAQRVIVAWDGIGDASGEPIEPTPEHIDSLMQDSRAFVAFQRKYLVAAMQVAEEGNG